MPTPLDRTPWTYLPGINGTGAFGNVKDSDLGTNWNNGGGFQQVGSVFGVDMGSPVSFGSCRIYQNAPEFTVETSDDAVSWDVRVASQLGGGSDTPVETNIDFGEEITARYIRFVLLDTDSFHYKVWEIDLFEFEPPPPPPVLPAGTREFQEDFETATHVLLGTSLTRRPDAVSLDHQIAFSYGPVAVEDISEGLLARAWYVRVEGQVLYIARSNAAITAWEAETELHDFAYSGPSLMDEIDFCFDSEGKPVVVAERTSGASDTEPQIWIYRWVDAFSDYILSAIADGRTPRCMLDQFPESPDPNICPPDINVQVLYFKTDEFLTRVEESEDYETEHDTEIETLPTRYLEEVFPTTDRRLSVIYTEHNEQAGSYAEFRLDSLPYPVGALRTPLFPGPTFDLVWLRGEPWRNPSGSTTTSNVSWRVETPDACDAIEIQCADSFPAGAQPDTGGIWTEQVTDSIAEGFPSLDAGDFVDFPITLSHGFGTMSPVAFRARTRRVVGEVTCYSQWRYYFAAREAIAGEFTDPNYTLHNCDHDAVICWDPVIDPWFYEYGVDDKGCNPCIGETPVCSAACAPNGFFVGGWQPDNPFTWRRDWSLAVRSRYQMIFSDNHEDYNYILLGKVFHTETEGAGVALSDPDISPLTQPPIVPSVGSTFTFPGWEVDHHVSDLPPVVRELPDVHLASYYDPTPLNGVGGTIPSVVFDLPGSTVVARARGSTVEAQFTVAHVFGFALLDSFVLLPPCTLLLTVYDDDGVSILFEVSTAADHPRPYLMEPDHYGEQEIDVAQGGATIGTVSAVVIDPPTIPGDQDSGYITARLATLGIADLAGHRGRWLRFISEEVGYQVIVDGPLGTPRLDSSYAGFELEGRDFRETERRVRLFDATVLSLVPDELPGGLGHDPAGGVSVIPMARPLRGRFEGDGSGYIGTVHVGLSEYPDNGRRIVILKAAYDAIIDGLPRVGGLPLMAGPGGTVEVAPGSVKDFLFKWRALESGDNWKEVPGQFLHVSLSSAGSTVVSDGFTVGQVVIQDRRLNPLEPDYDPSAPALPADSADIEFFLLGPVAPDERHSAVVEAIAVGDFVNIPTLSALGEFSLVSSVAGISTGTIDLTTNPGNAGDHRRTSRPIYERLDNASALLINFQPPNAVFRWRAAGSGDPWTEIPLTPGNYSATFALETPFDYQFVSFDEVTLVASDALVPADAQDIEFQVLIEPNERIKITAGLFAKNVYDGLYSARDPETGAVVPTGIKYDAAALALMTDLVFVRVTEPIENARDWLESHIYAPTGWVPALDSEGRISPVSQVAPESLLGLPILSADTVEPSSEWTAGDRIVNVLRFTYPRYFDAGPPDAELIITGTPRERRQSDIGEREVLQEYRDDVSISRHGEHVLELDGRAFATRGASEYYSGTVGEQIQKWNGAGAGAPILNTESELGSQLAALRKLHVHNRYTLGAPTFRCAARRAAHPTLRCGSWLVISLGYLPDYVTGRRGLLALGQVIAVSELDCAWRRLLIEQVVPLVEGS